jgi:hypothetical protein
MSTTPPPPPPTGGTRRVAAPPPPPAGAARAQAAPPPAPAKTAAPAGSPAPEAAPLSLTFDDLPPGFEARDGDTLHVTYGAIKLPLPAGRVGMVEVGGESYTRVLRAGDDVGEQHAKIYMWLKGRAERAANDKVAGVYAQFSSKEGTK